MTEHAHNKSMIIHIYNIVYTIYTNNIDTDIYNVTLNAINISNHDSGTSPGLSPHNVDH